MKTDTKNRLAGAAILLSLVVGIKTFSSNVGSSILEPQITLPATVVSIHDGDTMRVRFEVETSVRMLDCWAAELKTGEKGLQSKENLLKLCPEGSKVLIQMPFNADITKMLTFGRVLGNVYTSDGTNLSDAQVQQGFATKEKK